MKLTDSPHHSLLFLFSILGLSSASSDHSGLDDQTPCVARSLTSGLYYDLNAISLAPPKLKDGKQVHEDDRDESWHAKGYDYPANFTINICAPVIEDLQDVVGVDASRWQNVSAYYEQEGRIYSLGYGSRGGVPGFGRAVSNEAIGSKLQTRSSEVASSSSTIRMVPHVPVTGTRTARTPPCEQNRRSCPSSAIATLCRTRLPRPSSVPWTIAHTTSRFAVPLHVVASPRTPTLADLDRLRSLA